MNIELIKQKSGIIGESEEINQVLEMVSQVAGVDISVLINGESGTGKELVAKAIHTASMRSSKDLIIVNCGAIPEGIIESELFGHKKGAYTDASESRKGYFETANKGTIFLDEIGDMPLKTQVKVLRVLESGEYMRVGDSISKRTDTRVIAATNKNLAKLVKEGKFRQDLFYRINVIELRVPPLRERAEDIPLLANAYLKRIAKDSQSDLASLSKQALSTLKEYSFPGNVRELENILERAYTLCEGDTIEEEDLQLQADNNKTQTNFDKDKDFQGESLDSHLEEIERDIIISALEASRWNRTAAAKKLGVSFRSLRYRLKKLGLDHDE